MNETAGPQVLFNYQNLQKCKCPKCPVQAKSTCVSDKLAGITESLSKKPLIREDVPGVYCSTGTAYCSDLDPRQSCLCPSCDVFAQYELRVGAPADHYCRDGRAR